jgi:hypothetical protein
MDLFFCPPATAVNVPSGCTSRGLEHPRESSDQPRHHHENTTAAEGLSRLAQQRNNAAAGAADHA